jgi:hypothetical protein
MIPTPMILSLRFMRGRYPAVSGEPAGCLHSSAIRYFSFIRSDPSAVKNKPFRMEFEPET